MKEKSKIITLPCDCKCCMFVIEKTLWADGDINYNITIQDSRYDHNYNTIWGRIKRAAKILFGKPIYTSPYGIIIMVVSGILNCNIVVYIAICP